MIKKIGLVLCAAGLLVDAIEAITIAPGVPRAIQVIPATRGRKVALREARVTIADLRAAAARRALRTIRLRAVQAIRK